MLGAALVRRRRTSAFDLLVAGDDIRRKPLIERKAALQWVLRRSRGGIQYVEHAEGHGDKLFAAVCDLGLEGIVSKKIDAPYRSGPSKTWIKVKNRKRLPLPTFLTGRFDRDTLRACHRGVCHA